ncbi:Uncharacterised protein [Legionella busanensis]|uniref:Uncharacterized protein n=1 Tax=Legionella busanensis TaxID=190655 RepID=A0A378JQG5_9GAMM|nr:hypothetical protein [Legionella busanensis]STX52503.1 Uncharacterised protein [Legionella busanensis]
MQEFYRFKQIPILLWNIDPGYFYLKHAVKTIFAILTTLVLLNQEAFLTKVIGGLVCGFSMQGIVAKSYTGRLIQVTLFNTIYFGLFLLGLYVRDFSNLKSIVLIFLGFGVNYIRRFDLQTSLAPMMMWILCFLATILPVNTNHAIALHLHGVVVGLLVSALTLLLVFPENYTRLFVYNSNRLFHLLALGMLDIERYLLSRSSIRPLEEKKFSQLKNHLSQLLDTNHVLEQTVSANKQQNKINNILTHQHALIHAYVLMIEAYRILKIHGYHLSNTVRSDLGSINKQFSELLVSLKMHRDYSISGTTKHILFDDLTGELNHQQLSEPTIIMALLNLKLSFNLFNQHIIQLVRLDDGI